MSKSSLLLPEAGDVVPGPWLASPMHSARDTHFGEPLPAPPRLQNASLFPSSAMSGLSTPHAPSSSVHDDLMVSQAPLNVSRPSSAPHHRPTSASSRSYSRPSSSMGGRQAYRIPTLDLGSLSVAAPEQAYRDKVTELSHRLQTLPIFERLSARGELADLKKRHLELVGHQLQQSRLAKVVVTDRSEADLEPEEAPCSVRQVHIASRPSSATGNRPRSAKSQRMQMRMSPNLLDATLPSDANSALSRKNLLEDLLIGSSRQHLSIQHQDIQSMHEPVIATAFVPARAKFSRQSASRTKGSIPASQSNLLQKNAHVIKQLQQDVQQTRSLQASNSHGSFRAPSLLVSSSTARFVPRPTSGRVTGRVLASTEPPQASMDTTHMKAAEALMLSQRAAIPVSARAASKTLFNTTNAEERHRMIVALQELDRMRKGRR